MDVFWVEIKVNAMKVCRGSRDIAPLILNPDTGWSLH
jgi:hypothetical protein